MIAGNPIHILLKKAEKEYRLDLLNSYVVGDHPHDVEMAYNNVVASSIYLLTGHGKKHIQELNIKPDFIANDIFEATLWIMSRINAVTDR